MPREPTQNVFAPGSRVVTHIPAWQQLLMQIGHPSEPCARYMHGTIREGCATPDPASHYRVAWDDGTVTLARAGDLISEHKFLQKMLTD